MAGATSTLMLRLMGDDSDANKAMENIGAKAGQVIGKLAGVATAALGIGAAFSAAMDVVSAEGQLAGKLGVSPAEAAALGKTAGAVYANAWGGSMGEVTQGVALVKQELASVAGNGKMDIQGITEQAFALAQTFDIDIDQAIQGVGQLMRSGLVGDANQAMDLVTVAFQTMGTRGDDVLDTLKEYPVAFQALGISGKLAIGLINQGLKAGARDSDIVADALKEFGIRAKDGTTGSAAGFKALGLDAAKMTAIFAKGGSGAAAGLDTVLDKLRAMKDPAAQAAAASALFGTKAEDMQAALFALDPSTAVAGLGKVEGAAAKMTTAVGTSPQATLESFKRKVEVAIGQSMAKSVPAMQAGLDKFAPMIPQIVSGLTTVLSTAVPILVNVLTFLAPYIPTLTKIAAVAIAVKVAMMAWGAISGTVGAVTGSVRAASSAMALFRAGLAGAQATQLASTGQRLANMFGLMSRNIGLAVAGMGRWIATQAVAAATGIRTAATIVAQNVAMAAQATWAGIVRVATLIWTGVQWLLNAAFWANPITIIVIAVIALIAVIVLIATKTTWFQDIWKFVWGAITSYFTFVWGQLQAGFNLLVNIFNVVIPTAIRNFWGFVVGVFTQFNGFMKSIVDRVVGFFAGLGTFIFSTLPARIRGGIANMINNFTTFVARIVAAFLALPGRMLQIGSDIVSGIWRGISGAGGWLWDKVTGFAKQIWTTVQGALGIGSPSKVMADKVGQHIPTGVAMGIENNLSPVRAAALAMVGAATPNAGALAAASMSGTYNGSGGGGGDTYITVSLPVDGIEIARVLLKVQRLTGMVSVSPA